MTERMSPEDSAFWHLEADNARMHSVTLARFEGPAPSLEELQEHAERSTSVSPRLRQRVLTVPMDIARPVWADDPEFDIAHHVTSTRCPGGELMLRELVALIVSVPLERQHPLWHLTLVTDLPDRGWALISKVHHSVVDGISGTEPLGLLVGDPPAPEAPPPTDDLPTAGQLVGDAVGDLLTNPAEQARLLRANIKRAGRVWRRLSGGARPSSPAPFGQSALQGPVGPRRTWASTTLSLPALRDLRLAHDATLHDIVLALVAGGLRDLLLAHDESSNPPDVPALVPLAVGGNIPVGAVVASRVIDLPTSHAEFADRVAQLRSIDRHRFASARDLALLDGFAAPALMSLGLREATRLKLLDRGVAAAVVNAPGPRGPIEVLGRRMTSAVPVPPLPARTRVGIGIFSYQNEVTFGISADRDALPDAHVVTSSIRRTLRALLAEQELRRET